MKPFVLDSTGKSIKAKLSGAIATTQPDWTAGYADNDGSLFTEGGGDGALNSTTAVTLVSAPAASTRRIVQNVTVQNRDTAAVTMTVYYDNAGTQRNIAVVTLQPGDTWTFEGVTDTSGNAKTIQAPAAAGTLTGTTLAANVVTSSLTTVGALTSGSINWSGSIVTSSSITGGAISGTTGTFSGLLNSTNEIRAGTNSRTYLSETAGDAIVGGRAGTNFTYIHVNGSTTGTFTSTGLNNTVIGATTAAAGSFTTLAASGAVNGSSYFTGQGTNPGGLGGSRWVYDWFGGNHRQFSYGADASTNGAWTWTTQRSDGSNSVTPMSLTSTGLAVTGTLGASGSASFATGTAAETVRAKAGDGVAKLEFGAAFDVNLYRNSATELRTDDNFTAAAGSFTTLAASSNVSSSGSSTAGGSPASTSAFFGGATTGSESLTLKETSGGASRRFFVGFYNSAAAKLGDITTDGTAISYRSAGTVILGTTSADIATVSSTGLAVTGIIQAGSGSTSGAASGDVVLANGKALRIANNANSSAVSMITLSGAGDTMTVGATGLTAINLPSPVAVTGTLGASGNVTSSAGGFYSRVSGGINMASGSAEGLAMYYDFNVLQASRSSGVGLELRRTSSDGGIANFYRDTTNVGSISVTTTATAYNTSSDARLKTDLGAFSLADVAAPLYSLTLRKYAWDVWLASDDAATRARSAYGVFAQEARTTCPWLVTHDAQKDTWAVQWMALTPNIVAALQVHKTEIDLARDEIASLKARVLALEAA